MFTQEYGLHGPKVCWVCSGRGCSNCNNTGIRQQKAHIISDEQILQRHLMVQQKLKTVNGHIAYEDEKDEKILEDNSSK